MLIDIKETRNIHPNILLSLFVIAIHLDDDLENNVEMYRSPFGSTFRTFDATDYSSIGEN